MLQTFLAELKRRKVLRVVGAYAVVAWGVLQVIDKLFPALTLPPWTITFVAILLLIGLPITAIITWAFEVTPDGIRRTSTDPEATATARGSWIETALLVAIVVAVGVSFAQLRERVAAPAAGPAAATATATPAVATAANSIAVLPFTSFSDDADSNYFADGLTEELINELANIPGMKVSGRTSSFYFKNRNEDLREIGRTLGVSQVLEGSVRRAGDKLRITVQLISTADGFHLWSQTYDRRMDDIFAIQDDVAMNVASVLEMKIASSQRQDSPDAMHDMEDYRLYLIATALLRERSRESLTQARELFTQLKNRNPDNVDALAGYTQATMLLAGALHDDRLRNRVEGRHRRGRARARRRSEFGQRERCGRLCIHRAAAPNRRRSLSRAGRAHAGARGRTGAGGSRRARRLRHAAQRNRSTTRRHTTCCVARRARDPLSRVAQAQLITSLEGLGRLAEAREKLVTLGTDVSGLHLPAGGTGRTAADAGADRRIVAVSDEGPRGEDRVRARPSRSALAYLNLGLDDDVRATLARARLLAAVGAVRRSHSAEHARRRCGGSLRLAQTQLDKTNDPIWQSLSDQRFARLWATSRQRAAN